jgi:hypothetical protein
VPGARKDFLDRVPEAEGAIADGKVRRDLEPTLLDVDEDFTPALRAFAAGLDTRLDTPPSIDSHHKIPA